MQYCKRKWGGVKFINAQTILRFLFQKKKYNKISLVSKLES